VLIERDSHAEYKAVLEIDLAEIKEPILACPNDPDDVRLLSQVAGDKIDEVFIGSCMVNIAHLRAAGRIFDGVKMAKAKIWLTPPTKMDAAQLKREGYYAIFNAIGARIEIPGCSLCMGNQARVAPKATVMSTSTRNFDDRLGDGTRVYLGSAVLAAIAAAKGELPSPDEYFALFREKITPQSETIHRYLQFDEMKDLSLGYVR
jgi:aconitate hydratase 2/2-methylisocitrate dehydratase